MPDLGDAGTFALLSLPDDDDPLIDISSTSKVTGDVGVGPKGEYDLSGSAKVIGKAFLDATVTTSITGSADGGTIMQPFDLSQAISDAQTAAAAFGALASTQSFTDITDTATIVGNGAVNVIAVNSIDLSGSKMLTLSGGASDFFIFNVADIIDFTGSSELKLSGGVPSSHVLSQVQ